MRGGGEGEWDASKYCVRETQPYPRMPFFGKDLTHNMGAFLGKNFTRNIGAFWGKKIMLNMGGGGAFQGKIEHITWGTF